MKRNLKTLLVLMLMISTSICFGYAVSLSPGLIFLALSYVLWRITLRAVGWMMLT
jgi:hypothetical protein